MDSQQLVERFSPFIKKNILSIALALFGLMFLGYGLIVLIGENKSSSDGIVFEAGESKTSNPSEVNQITVDVEGAVLKPGVYNLSRDARGEDAIIAAGGVSETGDREWVAKNLNLAQKLTDGAKIYVPKTGENIKGGIEDVTVRIENSLKGQININNASIKKLDGLPGVGLVTAQKIVDNRPYSTIDDLLSKKVVNRAVFEKMKEIITVY